MKKKILIYRLGSLGDTIMSLPCFHKIAEYYEHDKMYLLTIKSPHLKETSIESILGSTFKFEQVLNYPLGTRNPLTLASLLLKLRLLGIDTIINLSESRGKIATIRDYLFFKLAGITNLIGFSTLKEDISVSLDEETNLFEWEAKRLSRRISSLGSVNLQLDKYWDLHFTKEELKLAENAIATLESYPLIAIAPGAKIQVKDWGSYNWEELIKNLSSNLPSWKAIFIGSLDEYDLAKKCSQQWPNSLNLCGKLSPRVSAAVLSKASIFIGHDSGPMHLAACVGVPCVAIFSARNLPMQWFPRGSRNKIIYHKTECAGCGLDICIQANKKCITSIGVSEVQDAVFQVVEEHYNSLF